ncbi:hypothetical protein LWI29_001356 [Acer saccharum]|uniref:Myb-like domain-containing protein n=1 Tax=Acer saccharum TaxID=4024 RepID=A0AA39VEW2_ACESA|nr:hypothetical protein LWI29_001356 [Acer saccharum]KAK1554770.1 hypothetical protein Q3G72_017062 [Acer saccharum]
MLGDSGLSGDVATTTTTTTAAREAHEAAGTEAAMAAAAASNSGEEDKSRVFDENDRGFGGNRWPRQETVALLKIRSDMDVAFRDASVKGPLWDEVSRKLAVLGYHRNAKKCKEKFENVYKYHKRTKEGRTSKGPGKSYRFFDQLEAFGHQPPPPQKTQAPPPPQQIQAPSPPVVAAAVSMPNMSTSTTTTVPSTTHNNIPTNLLSNSTSSSTSSDMELGETRKRKRKWRDFFERLMKEVIDKQEDLQKKFLEAIEKREHERIVREEAWRMQEMTRINKEREILAQERSIAAAKDAAVMAFLQKISEQQNPTAPVQNNPLPSQPPAPPPPPQSQPQSQPQPVSLPPPPPPAPQPLSQQVVNFGSMKTMDNGDRSNFMPTSSSRWPKVEVEALINLRTNLDSKYEENGPKGPLWEEISGGMRKLGYNRSSKRCKEKWENINKYFKKVKESSKKRPEDSKTCPYFHQLDALYKEKNKFDRLMKPENSVPLMVQPEQQWPPHRQDSAMEDMESEDDKDGDEDEDDEAGGFEIVPNRQVSMDTTE